MTTASGQIPSTMLLLLSISLANAETINLSGMIRNKANKPVVSAQVQLAGDTAIKEVECPKELVELYYSSMHPKP